MNVMMLQPEYDHGCAYHKKPSERRIPGHVIVMNGPLGVGKTYNTLRAIPNLLDGGARVAYLTPTQALSQQSALQFGILGSGHAVGRWRGFDYVDPDLGINPSGEAVCRQLSRGLSHARKAGAPISNACVKKADGVIVCICDFYSTCLGPIDRGNILNPSPLPKLLITAHASSMHRLNRYATKRDPKSESCEPRYAGVYEGAFDYTVWDESPQRTFLSEISTTIADLRLPLLMMMDEVFVLKLMTAQSWGKKQAKNVSDLRMQDYREWEAGKIKDAATGVLKGLVEGGRRNRRAVLDNRLRKDDFPIDMHFLPVADIRGLENFVRDYAIPHHAPNIAPNPIKADIETYHHASVINAPLRGLCDFLSALIDCMQETDDHGRMHGIHIFNATASGPVDANIIAAKKKLPHWSFWSPKHLLLSATMPVHLIRLLYEKVTFDNEPEDDDLVWPGTWEGNAFARFERLMDVLRFSVASLISEDETLTELGWQMVYLINGMGRVFEGQRDPQKSKVDGYVCCPKRLKAVIDPKRKKRRGGGGLVCEASSPP